MHTRRRQIFEFEKERYGWRIGLFRLNSVVAAQVYPLTPAAKVAASYLQEQVSFTTDFPKLYKTKDKP